jgi:hypothetical protein
MYDIVKITTEKSTGHHNVDVVLSGLNFKKAEEHLKRAAFIYECAGFICLWQAGIIGFSAEVNGEIIKMGTI